MDLVYAVTGTTPYAIHKDEPTVRKVGIPRVTTMPWHGTCLLEGCGPVPFFLPSYAGPSGTLGSQESPGRAQHCLLQGSVCCRQPKHTSILGHL